MDPQEMMEQESPDMEDQESENSGSPLQQKLGVLAESTNIAEKLSKEELEKIGKEAKEGFEKDLQSRGDWEIHLDSWTKLASQVVEEKSFPWPKASNIKYPLLSTAAMQFAARAYPSLIPSNGQVVNAKVIGKDPDGSKSDIAEAVGIYMSYQLMDEMYGWEADMDKLLIMLPIVGTMFKKTYWDSVEEVNCSYLVLPKNLVVNYWARDLCSAERISEIMEINPRILKERQMSGLWLDKKDYNDIGDPSQTEAAQYREGDTPSADDTTPYIFVEQHTYLDLDEDGYKEPYIVTFHKATGKVFRIVARYDDETMFFTDEGKLARIKPVEYYTKYGFVPNPDGSFYDIGFGTLLGPINESVNTLVNQIVDAGTLSNLQSGFIGKGLRLRMGETKLQPGEWRAVNSTGDDLKKQIVPLPVKDPSNVLYQLLEFLVTAGKELASVAEIFVGKMPGQNTPATTTMASIEQGMKVFTAVYKRVYRAMSEEFDKLYRLNRLYINPNTIVGVVDMPINPEFFTNDNHQIYPAADPAAVTQTEKLLKAQGLLELLGQGMPLDPVKVMIRVLEAQEQPNYQDLIPQQIQQTGQMPPPPPDPKVQALQMKAQADMAAGQQEMMMRERQATLDQQGKQQDIQNKQQLAQITLAEKTRLAQLKLASQVSTDHARIAAAQREAHMSQAQSAQEHMQTMQQNAQVHQQELQQMKEAARAQPNPQGKGATKK